MGIRTRETTEYFPKLNSSEQVGVGVTRVTEEERTEESSVSIVQGPRPLAVHEELREDLKGTVENGPDGIIKEEEGESLRSTSVLSSKVKGASKLKNGIVKVNKKMKKGMRIMMEKSNKILERSRNCKKQTKKMIVVCSKLKLFFKN